MSARRALFYSFLDRYAALILSIGSSMIIARLLTPADLGVFSIAMVLVLFVSSMRDMGAGQYIVQQAQLGPSQISAAWTVLLMTGWCMALLVALAAHPMAAFYREPRMVPLLYVIALNFLVSPFGSMTYAWLMREMRFEVLAVMRFSSSLAGAATSVVLALQGHGPMSLAIGNLVATIVNAALAAYFRPARFGWWPKLAGTRQVVLFGSKISASGLIWNLATGAPELFLGKLQGMAAAAYFSRGNGLAVMFQRLVLDATQSVAMPLFAKARRESGDFNAPFQRATIYVTALGWSFFLGMALLADPLIRVLYGPQWDDAVDLTRLLAAGMALALPAAMVTQALMAAGQVNGLLKFSVAAVALQVVCVGAGATHSLEAAGIGFAVGQLGTAAGWLMQARRLAGIRLRPLLQPLARSAAVALITGIVPVAHVAIFGLQPRQELVAILVCSVAGAAAFVGALFLVGHPLKDEVAIAGAALKRRLRR